MDSLKYFGVFRKLLPDIFRADEDVDEDTPIFLHFKPFVDNNINSSKFLSPFFDY